LQLVQLDSLPNGRAQRADRASEYSFSLALCTMSFGIRSAVRNIWKRQIPFMIARIVYGKFECGALSPKNHQRRIDRNAC